jgi:hypothetical protein
VGNFWAISPDDLWKVEFKRSGKPRKVSPPAEQ